MNLRRDVFQAIADPTRRAILLLLASKSMTAGVIASNFDAARPTISKHIQILTECQLLQPEQSGRKIYYHLNPRKVSEVSNWVEQLQQLWEGRFNRMESLLKNFKNKD
jgi:DNA-binding transcriptional ArsR family regulator